MITLSIIVFGIIWGIIGGVALCELFNKYKKWRKDRGKK